VLTQSVLDGGENDKGRKPHVPRPHVAREVDGTIDDEVPAEFRPSGAGAAMSRYVAHVSSAGSPTIGESNRVCAERRATRNPNAKAAAALVTEASGHKELGT